MVAPNYDHAATKAAELLVRYKINATPISPLPILKTLPGVLVVSFAEMAFQMCEDRQNIMTTFSMDQDAVTSIKIVDGNLRYIVAYNQRLPFYMLQRALARELAHIVLQHDGTLPQEVRMAEAHCFANHFLCPRPVLKAIEQTGIIMTIENLGCVTGCYERCLIGLRKTPACHVPVELNRQIKSQFLDYIKSFAEFVWLIQNEDNTPAADFGTFMDGYEE